MADINDIERAAKKLSEARDVLAERLQRLRDEQEAIKRQMLRGLRGAVDSMRRDHEALVVLVTESPSLFSKPKTRTLHGFRVGWMKRPGKMEIGDDEQVCALVRKLLPNQADALIIKKEMPNKRALAELPAKDLKRLGVAVTDDTDAPFVKSADGDLDKLIDALLSDPELEKVTA